MSRAIFYLGIFSGQLCKEGGNPGVKPEPVRCAFRMLGFPEERLCEIGAPGATRQRTPSRRPAAVNNRALA